MATGPVDGDDLAALPADELAARCRAAEAEAARLRSDLAAARTELAQLAERERAARNEPTGADDQGGLGIFPSEDAPTADALVGDGSDPRVLSVILTATAVVTGMVGVLALVNGNLFSGFGLVIVVLTVVLAWAAVRTRVVPVEVSIVRGMVYIEQGDSSHRFDIRTSPRPSA
ncbi:hypothetical protein [Nocardioides sambongensis]|uniref:hypothetical protein n=1 Tax=Nocardioides sambongensis TaxID=2589074 RepID=UPI00112AFB2B|nr:hypothetical protein [Nocardioides sambongensis]